MSALEAWWCIGVAIVLYVVDEGFMAIVHKKVTVSDRVLFIAAFVAVCTSAFIAPLWLIIPRRR